MKIIRWLLSHTFLILVIVAVIYGYMFWGNLAGEDTPAGKAIAYLADEFEVVDEFVEAVKEKNAQHDTADATDTAAVEQEEPASSASATADSTLPVGSSQAAATSQEEAVSASSDSESPVTAAAADRSSETQSNNVVEPAPTTAAQGQAVEQTPVNISYSQNNMRVQQDNSGVVATQEATAAAASQVPAQETAQEPVQAEVNPAPQSGTIVTSSQGKVSDNQAQSVKDGEVLAKAGAGDVSTFVSPEIEQQLANVDDHGKVIDHSLQGGEVRESWITARKSFYQRNYALSEESYKNVIDQTDDNFDAYGELGNVYFNQGKKELAASAYYEAAAILVKKGQIRRARSLMGLLRHLDKTKAEQLQKIIESAPS